MQVVSKISRCVVLGSVEACVQVCMCREIRQESREMEQGIDGSTKDMLFKDLSDIKAAAKVQLEN